MKRDPANPFLLTGYHSPRYFCDRTEEFHKLEQAIKNERNITLFSIRRLGKTALLRHTFYYFDQERHYESLYSDVL